MAEADRPNFRERAILYVSSAVTWANALGVDGVPVERLTADASDDKRKETVLNVEMFMDEIRARNIRILEPNLALNTVPLDENWKQKVTTFIGHIREVVNKAEMDEKLREPILKSLNKLQSDVDRNRTRVDALSDLWLELTAAIGEGVQNLEPAIKMLERLRKVVGKAQKLQIEAQENPKLPPPEDVLDEE